MSAENKVKDVVEDETIVDDVKTEDEKDVKQDTPPDVVDDTTKTEDEKTFKQSEVDTMIQKRVSRAEKTAITKAQKALETDVNYKEFKEWQDTKKTNDEKNLDTIKDLTDRLTKAEQKAAILERTDLVSNKKVLPKFRKFVISEIAELVDDNTDFETALEAYDYSAYIPEEKKEDIKNPRQTSARQKSKTTSKTSNQVVNDMIRRKK